jgi:hypothetical protein
MTAEVLTGGKARNVHPAKRKSNIHGTGTADKVAVMGILERGGRATAKLVDDIRAHRSSPRLGTGSSRVRASTPIRFLRTPG